MIADPDLHNGSVQLFGAVVLKYSWHIAYKLYSEKSIREPKASFSSIIFEGHNSFAEMRDLAYFDGEIREAS